MIFHNSLPFFPLNTVLSADLFLLCSCGLLLSLTLVLNFSYSRTNSSPLGLSIAPLSASDRKEVTNISRRWFLEDFDVVAFSYTPVQNHVSTEKAIVALLFMHLVLVTEPCLISSYSKGI